MSQSSSSQRIVSLVAVANGKVWVLNAGGSIWGFATNATGHTLNTTGVVRSAVNNQKLWFADGAHWLYYDPSTNAVLNWTASSGSLPVDGGGNTPTLICTWRGRTVLSGLLQDGQNWFMSAVNDPTNWNYNPFPVVATQAVAGNNSSLGLIGDGITCLIPYSDDTLIFGCYHSIWQCSGDPADGGRIDNISTTIGMAFGNPWCRGPDGTLYFVSNRMGIYSMQPGQAPVRMSQPIEQLIYPVDTGANLIRLLWDDRWQGFHVWITQTASAAATTHYFWESRTGAWWSDVFATNAHNPLAVCQFDGNLPADRHNLIGSWDGNVRQLSPSATNDDGTSIASAVVIGPLLTKDLDEVLLKDMQAVLGENTLGSVSYAVYTGVTAEAALAASPVASGTWSASRNLTNLVQRAGHAHWIKLTASNAWALESIRTRVLTKGKVRRRGH